MRRSKEPDFASPTFKAEPYEYWARMRGTEPVHKVRLGNGAEAWLVTRYEDAVVVLGDPAFAKDALQARGVEAKHLPWLPGPLRALSRNMLDLDEPDHRRLRNLVQKAFTPRVVDDLRPRIEQIAAELLDAIERRERGTADLIADYAAPLPVTVIAEMLGVPPVDRPRFRSWSNHIVAADTSTWHKLKAIRPAISFVIFLRRLIAQRRQALGNDLLSLLIAAQEKGDRLNADELLSMCFLLLIAGHETTMNLIGNGVLDLLRNPDQMELLRHDPSLIAPAVEEMLRFSSPLQFATERYTSATLEIGNVTVPRGSLVYVVLSSANRDDSAFAAERFDIARGANRHLAFGHGIHYCFGAPLARLEGQIAIRALLDRFRDIALTVEPDQLRWRRGLVLRGLTTLPVHLIPAAR
ncbi:MAG TPA: cytochrome P450 [Thermoanaerobaculia bacterium]|jgi:cytochrome P450 PksS